MFKSFEKAAKLDESPLMRGLSDPPAWWYPPRRSVAAALLLAGKPKEALAQAELALVRRPNDPVTLSLRAEAQTALGQMEAAARSRALAKQGWHGDKAGLAAKLA